MGIFYIFFVKIFDVFRYFDNTPCGKLSDYMNEDKSKPKCLKELEYEIKESIFYESCINKLCRDGVLKRAYVDFLIKATKAQLDEVTFYVFR